MSEGKLELLGPYEAWHGAAHVGQLNLPDGTGRHVLVVLGSEGGAGRIDGARARAADALRLQASGVLRLLQLTPHGGRVAWIYEYVRGLGLGHVVGGEQGLLPSRAAAEVVALVSDCLIACRGAGLAHPGPEPSDLLVDARGRVRIAGFAGPFESAPSMRAPGNGSPEAALVYRLGVLLAHLVSGTPPAPASHEAAHEALVRRALIRAMARPGPVLTERYGDWLRAMLAWDPSQRPALSTLPDGLRLAGTATGGDGLRTWAETHVQALTEQVLARQRYAQHAAVDTGEFSTSLDSEDAPTEFHDLVQTGPPPRRIPTPARAGSRGRGPSPVAAAFRADEFEEDDPTQEAASLPGFAQLSMNSQPPPELHMPVQVGPPPEAVRKRPTLPEGFLEEDEPEQVLPPAWDDVSEASIDDTGFNPMRVLLPAAWVVIMFGMCIIAVIFLAYLMYGGTSLKSAPAPASDGPSLADALTRTPAEGGPADTEAVEDVKAVHDTDAVEDVKAVHDTDAEDTEAVEDTESGAAAPPKPEPSRTRVASSTPLEPTSRPPGISVYFRSSDPIAIVRARCGGQKGSGEGGARLFGLKAGDTCTISADLGRGPLEATWTVSEDATVECFEDGKSSCR